MSEAIIVLARFKVKPGMEKEALEAFASVAEDTHREDGCEKYAWIQAVDDDTQFAVVEKWRDRKAMSGHGESTHLTELRAKLADLLSEPASVVRYSELALGQATQGVL